jgi:hypothetical protein
MIIGISGKKQSGKNTVASIIQYLTDKSSMGYFHPDGFKDYVEYLKGGHNTRSHWQQKSFAGKLKQCVALITGCTVEQLEDEEFKNKSLGEEWIRYGYADGFYKDQDGNTIMNNKQCSKERYKEELRINWQTAYRHEYTYRNLLQLIGTEVVRAIHEDTWVNALFADYKLVSYQYALIDHANSNVNIHKLGEPVITKYPKWIITDCRFPNELQAIKDRDGISIRVNRSTLGELGPMKRGNYKIPNTDHPSETSLDNATFDYVIDNNGTLDELIDKVKQILIKEKLI